jgi:hypothetical protein
MCLSIRDASMPFVRKSESLLEDRNPISIIGKPCFSARTDVPSNHFGYHSAVCNHSSSPHCTSGKSP